MGKVDLSQYDNSWYKPGGSILSRLLWYCINAAFFNSFFPFYSVKVLLLRIFGAKIGSGVVIKPRVNIKYPWNITIGDHSWIGENAWLDSLGKISMGANCCLSQGAMLICGNHDYTKPTFDLMVKDIVLEDGVWIGAGSLVCSGVTCRSHAVLSAGSVASKDLDAYSVYQGNPAVKIKDREIL